MFANLFKPKWRHSSPAVRVRAVARLQADRPAHSDILRQLLLDDHSCEVRRAALSRVDDPALLLQVLRCETEPELRQCAANAIAQHLGTLPEQERNVWFGDLFDCDSLAALVMCDADTPIQQQALALIKDETTLISLAVRSGKAQLRRSAAERVTQPELLETLCRESRGSDKSVHRIARDALQTLKEQERELAVIQQKRADLLTTLDTLINGLDQQHFQARFDIIARDWEQLPTDPEQDTAFLRLAERAHTIIAELKREREQEIAEAREAEAHRAACEVLERDLHASFAGSATADTNTTDQLTTLCERIKVLAQQAPLPPSLQSTQQLAEHYLSAQTQLEQRKDALQSMLTQPLEQLDNLQLEQQLDSIRWPKALDKPSLLLQAEQQLKLLSTRKQEKQEQVQQLATQLEHNLVSLESAIQSGEIRVAARYQDQASDQLQRLNGTATPQLEQRYKTLIAQLQEMKDWQGFAINGKKEALCEQMEALIDADMAPQALADQVRALQQEWKALDVGASVHSQKLWQRFRRAAETAYTPCEAHFSAMRQVRKQNLEQREEICRQLSQLIETIDWESVDWPMIERISHTAKREWKQFSPVDRAPGKAVQNDFNQLIRTLDHKLRDWHQQCADIKQQLIGRAAELADLEDIRAAADEAKELQNQWKATGPAFRSEERALWQAFRGHCDTIFARLRESKPTVEQIALDPMPAPMKEPELATFNSCAEMLLKAETAILEGDSGMLDKVLDAVRSSTRQLPDPWREALLERISVIEQTLISVEQLEAQLAESEQRIRELCIRLEILLGQPTPDEDQAQRMEYQMHRLQQALAEQHQNPSTRDVIELDLEWKSKPYNGVFPQLRRRFERLMHRTAL